MSEGIVGETLGAAPINPLWRPFFWLAAIFNFVIGALNMFVPEANMDARILGLLIFAFGVIYAMVARDPARYGPTLWAGFIGKVGVVALLGPQQFGASGDILLATVLGIDALFAAGFLIFLLFVDNDG